MAFRHRLTLNHEGLSRPPSRGRPAASLAAACAASVAVELLVDEGLVPSRGATAWMPLSLSLPLS